MRLQPKHVESWESRALNASTVLQPSKVCFVNWDREWTFTAIPGKGPSDNVRETWAVQRRQNERSTGLSSSSCPRHAQIFQSQKKRREGVGCIGNSWMDGGTQALISDRIVSFVAWLLSLELFVLEYSAASLCRLCMLSTGADVKITTVA